MRGAEFIRLEFADLLGELRGFEIPKDKYDENKYISLDGSSIPGFTPIEASDLYLKPVPSTFKENSDTAFVFCDLFAPDKKRFRGDPKYILESTIEKTGLEFMAGVEPEFYLLKEKRPHDSGGYFHASKPLHTAIKVKREIVKELKDIGLDVELKHHEVGPGQYEINFKADNAVKTARNVLLFKRVVRETAYNFGTTACFMPKPFHDKPGNGMHVHLSAWEGSKNLFHDPKAGLTKFAKSLGYRNRSALIRIPVSDGKNVRLEYRSPDPSANPFLAFAVMIAAGMDGVERALEPPEPVNSNAYHNREKSEILPEDLREALDEMKRSKLVREVLGKHAFNEFLKLKRKEWKEHSAWVSEWEREKYMMV